MVIEEKVKACNRELILHSTSKSSQVENKIKIMKNSPAATTSLGLQQQHTKSRNLSVIPTIKRTESGRIGDFETFSHYVARQIGFEDPSECPQLCKLAYDYLRKSNGCEENIFDYIFEAHGESIYARLVEELDRCILAYFAYHWTQTSAMISQVLSANSEQKTKLRKFVLAATRPFITLLLGCTLSF